MTDLKEIAELLKEPRARLKVAGYVRSDGSVWDMIVTRMDNGSVGYTELLRSAVGRLDNQVIAVPAGFTVTEWTQAKEEQRNSWLKHLHDHSSRLSIANERPTISFGSFEQYTPDPRDGLIIRHCLVEKKHVAGPDGKAKSEKARAKQCLREMLGVEAYEGKLIFTDGKFRDITRA